MLDKDKNKNLGFILKQSLVDASSTLNDSDFRKLVLALFKYATKNEEPELDNPTSNAIYLMEKPSIDKNNEKWRQRQAVFNIMQNKIKNE